MVGRTTAWADLYPITSQQLTTQPTSNPTQSPANWLKIQQLTDPLPFCFQLGNLPAFSQVTGLRILVTYCNSVMKLLPKLVPFACRMGEPHPVFSCIVGTSRTRTICERVTNENQLHQQQRRKSYLGEVPRRNQRAISLWCLWSVLRRSTTRR